MGIDIYAAWRGMKASDKAAQITGFSVHHGHVGYLREAYHGAPYATRVLVPEAFEEKVDWVEIPARRLRERLPEMLRRAKERELIIDGRLDEERCGAVERSFTDFVELCEAKEQETGQPCLFRAAW